MSQIVRNYYNEFAHGELGRLQTPYTQFEFVSTLSLIEQYMQGNSVIDVGSGPGVYSAELLQRGYQTTLWDLSDTLLDIAKEELSKKGLMAEDFICDSAVHLLEHNTQYDSLLLMGPMYHILGEEQRKLVMQGVKHVLKPGGIGFVAFLNSWGVLRAGMHEFPEEYNSRPFLHRYLSTFERSVESPGEEGFTDVFLTTPPEAQAFLEESGFTVLTYVGAEGCASGMEQAVMTMAEEQPEAYKNLLEIIPTTSKQYPFRDMTEHTVFVIKNS